jgi:hypothetical protein
LYRTAKIALLVFMERQSSDSDIPTQMANLFQFASSLDLRRFKHGTGRHSPSDRLESPADLRIWMSERGLLRPHEKITSPMLQTALQLRSDLRALLACEPGRRKTKKLLIRSLNSTLEYFPLLAEMDDHGRVELKPMGNAGLAGLSRIVAEFHQASANGTLNRLKECAADECRKIFFDRMV